MDKKKPYGSIVAEDFQLGDIVEWSKWCDEHQEFIPHYGIITEINNKVVSNRMVSNCVVVPLDDSAKEIELFTLSLRLVSKAGDKIEKIDS